MRKISRCVDPTARHGSALLFSSPSPLWALLVAAVPQNKALEHLRRNAPADTVDWRQCVTQESLNAALVAIGDDSSLKNQAPESMRGVKFWNLTDERIEIAAMDFDGSELMVKGVGAFDSQQGEKLVRTTSLL